MTSLPAVIPPKHGPFTVWAARVGPYNSPYEGHDYFQTLPLCHFVVDENSTQARRPVPRLGELMGGYSWRAFANLEIPEAILLGLPPERVSDPKKVVTSHEQQQFHCTTKPLAPEEALALTRAVEHRWFYQLFLTNLPVWGMVGEMLPDRQTQGFRAHVYTQTNLVVSVDFQGDIVQVDLISDPASLTVVDPHKSYDYRFTVDYAKKSGQAPPRYERYVDHKFFQDPTRSFAAINSSLITFCILCLLVLFVRSVWKHNNHPKNSGDPEQGNAGATEALLPKQEQQQAMSKKLDPTKVFLPPYRLELLAALLGNGWHLYFCALLMSWWMKDRNPLEFGFGGRWEMLIYGYAATSVVAGYVSSYSFWQQHNSSHDLLQANQSWGRVLVLTALLLPVCAWTIGTILFVADALLSSIPNIHRISYQGMQRLLLLWFRVVLPCQFTGSLLGKWHQGIFCASNIGSFLTMSMPPLKNKRGKCVDHWIATNPSCAVVSCGMLCFGAIFVESFFLMTALWKYKFYITTWANLASLLLLFLTAGSSSAVITLVLFSAAEETSVQSWQWRAFWGPASSGIYCLVYSIYYYFFKSSLEGWYTLIHYFGTMLLLSAGVALMCGAMGHFVAYQSVRFLYSNVKAA